MYWFVVSCPLLYNFTATQCIGGRASRKKQMYLMFSYFSSYYKLAFVAYSYAMLKTFILKLPDPSPEHNIAPVLNSDNYDHFIVIYLIKTIATQIIKAISCNSYFCCSIS